MPALTPEQILLSNPDKAYHIRTFVLNHRLWPHLFSTLRTHLSSPKKVLFDENIRNHLSTTSKGIYVFTVEPEIPFPPPITYFMYVGKVTGTNSFHDRFSEYVSAIGKINVRANIRTLTNLWPGKTWVYVYELTLTDKEIEDIETNIYNHVVPPLNNKFSLKRAYNSRSIY